MVLATPPMASAPGKVPLGVGKALARFPGHSWGRLLLRSLEHSPAHCPAGWWKERGRTLDVRDKILQQQLPVGAVRLAPS